MLGVAAKVFSTVFVGIQLAGLAIAIAGVAILQENCNKNDAGHNFAINPFGLGPNLVRTMLVGADASTEWANPSGYDCGMQYSWYWWVLALQLLCSSAGLLSIFIRALHRGKLCIVAFYSTATALWCVFAYAMVWAYYLYQAWDWDEVKYNNWAHGYECGAVGAIITLAGNFMFMMVYGYDSSVIAVDGPEYHHQHVPTSTVVLKEAHTPQTTGFHAA